MSILISISISIYLYITCGLSPATAQLCPGEASGGAWFGLPSDDPSNPNTRTTPETYIIYTAGTANCHGVIKEWQFSVPGGCVADLQARFEIWKVDGANYRLVGYNNFDPTACTDLGGDEVRLGIPVSARLPVYPGDIMGWSWLGGADSIDVSNGGGSAVAVRDCTVVTPGNVCPDPGPPIIPLNLDFLLQALLIQGAPPVLDNLDKTVEVFEGDTGFLFNVLASHPSNSAQYPVGGAGLVEPNAVTFTFTFLPSGYFTFNPTLGELEIRIGTALDYETQTSHVIPISVTALDQTVSGALTVNVKDLNEPHIILNVPTTVFVKVTDPCQVVPIITVQVDDVDTVITTKNFYILTTDPVSTPDAPFYISPTTGELFCTADLATWSTQYDLVYDLEIAVSDSMHQVKEDLTVEIQQAFDKPVILNLDDTVDIREDLSPGPAAIFTVYGNGQTGVQFSIIEITPRPHSYHFSIDPNSGDISLSQPLDFALYTQYQIEIGIEDDIQTGDTAFLTVNVIWINQSPIFNPEQYFVTIDEECDGAGCDPLPPPTNLPWPITGLTISIIDRDIGLPVTDVLSCEVLHSTAVGPTTFSFTNTLTPCDTVYIEAGADIDNYPQDRMINLTLRVQDLAGVNDNAGDIGRVYITMQDINDNWPTFDSPGNPYTATIEENTPGGVSLFDVLATDRDSGDFGTVTYSLRDDPSSNGVTIPYGTLHFEIHPVTGVVQTKQALDYESLGPSKEVPFIIRASDCCRTCGPTCGNSREEDAIVTVINVNDEHPVFNCSERPWYEPYDLTANCFYNLELRADTLVGYEIMNIWATDIDSIDADLTYHLLQPISYFSLGLTDGLIAVANPLGKYVKYIMYCYSQDTGVPVLITQPHLRVRIDTFDPKRQLINIVLQIPMGNFNSTAVQDGFITELGKVLTPWFPKIETFTLDKDKTTVTIYALKDTSTYDEKNLALAKQFVDRDELLKVLRKNIKGTPKDILKGPGFAPYDPILVEPTYPIWIIDTIPGIVTLALICAAFVALVLGLTLGLCRRYNKCCFKKEKPLPDKSRWQNNTRRKEPDYDQLSNASGDSFRRPESRDRRESVDTVHSTLFRPRPPRPPRS